MTADLRGLAARDQAQAGRPVSLQYQIAELALREHRLRRRLGALVEQWGDGQVTLIADTIAVIEQELEDIARERHGLLGRVRTGGEG